MPRGQGGTLSGFTPLSTPNAPTDLSVSTSIGSATVSFTAPSDTGDAAVTSYIVTAVDESTGVSTGATGSSSPITVSPGGGTFKIRAQAVNGFGPGRLTEFSTGNSIFSGAEIYAFGRNNNGQVGDNTTVNRSSPVQIGALTNWSQVAAGGLHVVSVKTGGTLWAWGRNSFGQVGDNTTVNRSSPVQIGALTTWSQVAAGYEFSAALKTDGTLWTWGQNNNGQLGQSEGSSYNKSSPVQVGALTTWSQVAAAANGYHISAIKTDGTLWVWGRNDAGQLGQGTVVYRSSPVQVGALTTWSQVALGRVHTLAVKTDGTLWAWGNNGFGRLGTNDTIFRSSPVQVGSLTNWAQVSGGGVHSAAIKVNGTLWTWGGTLYNSGQLGLGDTINRSSPTQVGGLTNWKQVSGGYSATGAVKTDGTLWAWGANNYGQVGDNTVVYRSSPVQVGALTSWLQVSLSSVSVALSGVV